MKKARVTKIGKDTYRFTETSFGTDVYMYLLIGTEKALLIDTAYGFTDVPAAIRQITDLPLIVVNTHGHMDHMHGNHLYPQVHISRDDREVFLRHSDPEYLMGLMEEIARENKLPQFLLKLPMLRVKDTVHCEPSTSVPLPEQMYFELGRRKVSIPKTPGHTIGSITLLDEKNKWAFSGDTTCQAGVLLQFPESASVQTFRSSVVSLKELVQDGRITTFFPAHQQTPLGTDILDVYISNCDRILNGPPDAAYIRNGFYACKKGAIRFDSKRIWEA